MAGFTSAEVAFRLVQQGEIKLLMGCKVSLNFTWGEFLVHRTAAQIKRFFKLKYAKNIVFLAGLLEKVRSQLGNRAIKITSGWRDAATQAALVAKGVGAKFSRHLIGLAVDIQVAGMTAKQVYKALLDTWPQLGGLGDGSKLGFTHLDWRGFAVKPFNYA